MTEQKVTQQTCRHCGRGIINVDGVWTDPEATGDDSVWRETCDMHDTFDAVHEPATTTGDTSRKWRMIVGSQYCFHDTTRVSIVCDWQDEDESGESTVAEVWPGDNDCDIRDGRLIAAAPDLLAAAQQAYDVLPCVCGDDAICDCTVAMLGAAIEKAEGR